MKAVLATTYGPPDVLEWCDVERPTPKANELLIKVHATTVSAADWRIRSLTVPTGFGLAVRLMFGLKRLKQPILGTELAGEVVAVGGNVTKFAVGDHVFAFSGSAMGCHAEYKTISEDGAVALKPPNLSWEEAAAISFGGATALTFLKWGKIRPGDQVLINGASGSVGTAAVQLAKHFGAQVTGVCSGVNLELVRSIGADRVIDYTRDDFTAEHDSYDIIMDTAGTAPFSRAKKSLKKDGRLLAVLAGLPTMLLAPLVSRTSRRTLITGTAPERGEDLRFLAELAEAGKFRPVIDRCYPFEQIVEAHRYVDQGHKKGNVVISMAH